jgi:sarcosine oxidase, subunit delta
MIVLRCPYCNEQRTEEELTYGGEAGIARPGLSASDTEWTDYLFMRTNPKGVHRELWCCSAGCGQWFLVARHTVTHEVSEIRRLDDTSAKPPSAHQASAILPDPELAGRVDAESAAQGYRR